MEWRPTAPTAPGWYWFRLGSVIWIEHVVWHDGRLIRVDALGQARDEKVRLGGEWAGPIEPPEDPPVTR